MSFLKNIALVVNPVHQKALRMGNGIGKYLTQKNIPHQTFTSQWPQQWDGFTEVWVVGGNGTLNHFINQYPHIHLPLAIFPGGTANDFQWMLYGEQSVEAQLERVLAAKPRAVDAGVCNNHLFINGIGIGFDGKVVQDLLGTAKWNGKLSYYRVVLRNVLLFQSFLCTILSESFQWGKKCLMVNVSNARRYGGGFLVTPAGNPTDGLFDVNIVGAVPALSRFRFLRAIERGHHQQLYAVTYLKTGSLHIKTAGIVPAHSDGEYFDASEFVIDCLPGRFSFLY